MQINHMATLREEVEGFVASWLPTGCQPLLKSKKVTTTTKHTVRRAAEETSVSGVLNGNFLYPKFPNGSLKKIKYFYVVAQA